MFKKISSVHLSHLSTSVFSSLSLAALVTFSAVQLSGCGVTKIEEGSPNEIVAPSAGVKGEDKIEETIASEAEEFLKKNDKSRYPDVSLAIEVKDVTATIKKIEEAEGRIDYDPNLGLGSEIPYLVVTIPAEKSVDAKFLESLGIVSGVVNAPKFKAMQADEPPSTAPSTQPTLPGTSFKSEVYVPKGDVGVDDYLKSNPNAKLGEGVLVSIIDTGIDASHPAFQDRVVYWADNTQETYQKLSKIEKISEGKFEFDGKKLEVPESLKSQTENLYVGWIDEASMNSQNEIEARLTGEQGLDINANRKRDDKLLVIVAGASNATVLDAAKVVSKNSAPSTQPSTQPATQPSTPDHWVAYVDSNGDEKWNAVETADGVVDFNAYAADKVGTGFKRFVDLSHRVRTIRYPWMIRLNSEKVPEGFALGVFDGEHATHVAGIVGGRGHQIVGVAPYANFMSMKVCSGITCTDAAILRGLIESFYNPQGYVPQVVNISLGSHQELRSRILDRILQDLAQKFGATFVISASNSGPGYRSINGLGSTSPVVQVAAHVSKNTRTSHYRLDPNLDVPAHNLLYFTSPGPSFTGELRPNVSAPGSAVAPVPLTLKRAQMFNGTSMSSPLTAGVVAAMWSEAMKSQKSVQTLNDLREKKIESIQRRSSGAPYLAKSLVTIPLSIRTALEETATRMEQYTIAQQGHGLIQMPAALTRFGELAAKLNDDSVDLPQFTINEDKGEGRLFDRSGKIERVKMVKLALKDDAEISDDALFRLRNEPVTVKLAKVEVQASNGTVEVVSDSAAMPFTLGFPGSEGKNMREVTLTLTSTLRDHFLSVRKLENLKPGLTYLANYEISIKGQRVLNVIDFVQVPYEWSATARDQMNPGRPSDKKLLPFAVSFSDVAISPLALHRYPISVTREDSAITLDVALNGDSQGGLIVQIYDPAGKQVGTGQIRRSNELPGPKSSLSLVTPSTKLQGTYEITIANASGFITGNSKYDLLVRTQRFRSNISKVLDVKTVASDAKKESRRILVLENSGTEDEIASLEISPIVAMQSMSDVKVIPGFETFRRLDIPQTEVKESTIVVSYGPLMEESSSFVGLIEPKLYTMGSDGVPSEVVAKADKDQTDLEEGRVTFTDVDLSKGPLYLAVETIAFEFDSTLEDTRKNFATIDLQVEYSDIEWEPKESLVKLLKADMALGLTTIEVQGPAESLWPNRKGVIAGAELSAKSKLGATLKLPIRIFN